MPQISPELITLLVQGGFAALFVWLLVTTRQEGRAREERLLALLDQYSQHLPRISDTLSRIEKRMDDFENHARTRG